LPAAGTIKRVEAISVVFGKVRGLKRGYGQNNDVRCVQLVEAVLLV